MALKMSIQCPLPLCMENMEIIGWETIWHVNVDFFFKKEPFLFAFFR
jgi:hypothetical protein